MNRYTKWVIGVIALTGLVWLTAAAAGQSRSSGSAGTPPGQGGGSSGQNNRVTPPDSANGDANSNATGNANGNATPPANGNGTGTAGGNVPGDDGQSPSTPVPPQQGATVEVAKGVGVVTITLPGTAKGVPLSGQDSIPVGATVDATNGKVELTSAVDATGRTQTGTFWGGVFKIRQQAKGDGYTELVLVGGPPSNCASAGMASISRRHKPGARLWGHDHHGHFRTRGQNSVATVRGTRWLTEERCGGTLTHVTQGAVAVRDLHTHRTVLVKAHHSHLARNHRAG
jgi:hypothetical protein